MLTGVTHDMRIMREEIFGPVLPIIVVDSEEEAVALANDSDFGLGASVWTSDRARGERIAGELESGMVWINDHMFSHGACQCAWGGVKDSGLGRTHSKFGLYECVNVKLRVWEGSAMRDPWWHPYDETLGKAMRSTAQLLYGLGGDPRAGAARRRRFRWRGWVAAWRRTVGDRANRYVAPAPKSASDTLVERCLPRPIAGKECVCQLRRGSATSPACRACSRRRSTSPACA